MNLKDEIVEEVRAAREAYAARFSYDLAEMYKDLKAKEQAHSRNIAADPRVSLLFDGGPPAHSPADPLAEPRLTLLGQAVRWRSCTLPSSKRSTRSRVGIEAIPGFPPRRATRRWKPRLRKQHMTP